MEYPPGVAWYLNIQSKTIKQSPTLLLCMEFCDVWWVPSVQDREQRGLANWDECEHGIQTSSHGYAGVPFTQWRVWSEDVAAVRCSWHPRGWFCEGKAWCRGIVFHSEEFDAWYPDSRQRSSTACGGPIDTDCKAFDDKEVVGIETSQCKTSCSETEGECTSHWSWEDWQPAHNIDDSGGPIHCTVRSGSMERL